MYEEWVCRKGRTTLNAVPLLPGFVLLQLDASAVPIHDPRRDPPAKRGVCAVLFGEERLIDVLLGLHRGAQANCRAQALRLDSIGPSGLSECQPISKRGRSWKSLIAVNCGSDCGLSL